jgi:hypothetical protein
MKSANCDRRKESIIHFAQQQACVPHVGFGSKAPFSSRPTNVRSTSKSGAKADILEPPLGARNGLMRCNKNVGVPFRLRMKLM